MNIDNLNQIYTDNNGNAVILNTESLERISQIYKDAGYLLPTDIPKGIYNYNGKQFMLLSAEEAMTGQEWFNRLLAETKLLNEEEIHKAYAIIDAARSASGIKDE